MMMRLIIDEDNISISRSMKRVKKPRSSWRTHLRRFIQRIQEFEVKETLKMMKTDKTLGPETS
jgi:predicted metal-dependent peptidase